MSCLGLASLITKVPKDKSTKNKEYDCSSTSNEMTHKKRLGELLSFVKIYARRRAMVMNDKRIKMGLREDIKLGN